MIATASGFRVPFTNFEVAMPVQAGSDGEIVDANGRCIAVVDHNRELPDEVVEHIVACVADAINRGLAS